MQDNTEDLDERRTSFRVDLEAERILLAWQDENGQEQTDDGICIDLARHGVLIEYKMNFKVGELLAITFNPDNDKRHMVKGQVCRTITCNPKSFHIAIQLI
ncbi:PilZ domain-containing protein [Shewanella psychrophila]|uniref:PilZ domain-containing protein n=1 Tax=Shewanella psychrophila TaxID=225848 RepID=A0A1S6HT55_9GAMM|nr:PilZ domain-containing protein [Shewanella psychrophila]AQS38726.1 PilZ domain-containing protein [Shewanella psychrophila]